MGLKYVTPSAASSAQTETEQRVVLLQIELKPAILRFFDDIAHFVRVVHLVAGLGRVFVDFSPGRRTEVLKRGMDYFFPFVLTPLTRLAP